MKHRLVVSPRGEPGQDAAWAWVLLDSASEVLASGCDALDAMVRDLAGQKLMPAAVILMLPGERVLYSIATLPSRQARHVQQALPFAIEDHLAQDIEAMHIVAGKRLTRDRWPVYAVAHDCLQPWYDAVLALDWPLEAIVAEPACCPEPTAEGGATLVIDANRAHFYAPDQAIFTVQLSALELFLDAQTSAADSAELACDMYLTHEDEQNHAMALAALEQQPGRTFNKHYYGGPALELLALSALQRAEPVFNLAQGAYPARGAKQNAGSRRWWPVAAVAALFFCLHTGMIVAEGWLYEREARAFEAQALALYQELFPGQRVVSSPRRQMEGLLRAGQGDSSSGEFLDLLTRSGTALRALPFAQAVRLNNIQFNQQTGQLALEMQAGSLDQLDRFKQALVAAGLQADLGSAVREQEGVRGRVTIGGPG